MDLSNGSLEPVTNSKIASIVLKVTVLFIFILCLMPAASARDYAMEEAAVNITVDPSGIVHVEESISYTFEGQYHEVFRKLNVLPGESIRNIKGYCSDERCKFSYSETYDGYELVGSLPDPTPEKVTFFVSYDHLGVVKVHKDVSEFQYKLWGSEWEKPLANLRGIITLPVNKGSEIQYWTHPIGYSQAINVEGNVINIRTNELPSNQWYEIRAVFPRIAAPNSSIVQINDEEGLPQIKSIENEYENQNSILKSLYYFTILYAIVALAFPIFIYFKYGKEPKIEYNTIYERELPTDSKPAVVNAIVQGKMGIPTMDGFTATIMDLANLGYISLRTVKAEESKLLGLLKSETEDVIIDILDYGSSGNAEGNRKNRRELEDFEKDAFNLLRNHAQEGRISWHKFKAELGKGTDFYEFINNWNERVKAHTAINKLFQSSGNKYIVGLFVVTAIAAFVYLIALSDTFPTDKFPLASNLNMLIGFIFIFEILVLIISSMFERVLGRWTPEGRLYYERWNNFKKYLTDFSALKEYPPESIKIWDHYLVYATALGVAKEVLDNMSLVVPSDELQRSNFYLIHGSYAHFGSGFGSAYAASAPSGSAGGGGGGVGGIGGGSGGGGGGAR